MEKKVNQLTVSGQSPSGVNEATGSNVAAQGPIISSGESSAEDAHLSPVEEAIQSDVDATSSFNVAMLEGQRTIQLHAKEDTDAANQISKTELAVEKELQQATAEGEQQQGATAEDLQEGTTAEKPEEPAKVAQGPIISSGESSAVDVILSSAENAIQSPVEEAIQSGVDATSSSNVAVLQGRSMINLDADEEIGEEMATEKELQEAATAQNELQEADTAEKPEEPAKVAKEAEVETMGKHEKMAYMPNNEQVKSHALSLEATQPNEMLAKAETKKGIVPQSTSAALGPVLPSANVVKVETNGVPQGQIEIFSIFAAQGPIISTSMVQDLDSSSDSDFEEVPSLPPLDEEKHSPKGSKRRHGKAKEGEPSPKKQKTQDKSKTYRVTDGV